MPLRVVDDPPDRPDWIRETVRLLADRLESGRARLLETVGSADDAALASGSDAQWGIGQIAVHLLVVERGVLVPRSAERPVGSWWPAPRSSEGAGSAMRKAAPAP